MSKRISADVNDTINTGEGVAVRLPDPPSGLAASIPAWEDRVEPHAQEEMDPRANPAHQDYRPSRLSGRDRA